MNFVFYTFMLPAKVKMLSVHIRYQKILATKLTRNIQSISSAILLLSPAGSGPPQYSLLIFQTAFGFSSSSKSGSSSSFPSLPLERKWIGKFLFRHFLNFLPKYSRFLTLKAAMISGMARMMVTPTK